jgi:aspartate kinase
MVVLKFGGTSVGEVESIRRVVGIVAAEWRPGVVVVSALAGVTDELLHLAAAGGTIPGNPAPRALEALRDRHLTAARMVRDREARTAVELEIDAVTRRVAATLEAAPGRLTPRERDEVAAAGELWSSRLLTAALVDRGVPATWIDARDVLRTDSHHGAASPDLSATREAVSRLVAPRLQKGQVVVLGGFIGSDAGGATTTLGRGGSDCSAAVLGACLDAAEIQIWTDVDGVLTADPRVIPHARLVPTLSYGEAHDLASFGAKVLHPGTIQPAVERAIPVVVRNSYRPDAAGTVVSGRGAPRRDAPVAGLACCTGVTLVEVVARTPSPDGFVAGVFEALRATGVEAVLADLCGNRLVVTAHDLSDASLVRDALARVGDVRIRTGLAAVCAVGEGLAAQPQLANDALTTLGDLPIHLLARPSGGRTLAFVVDARHAATAMSRLHARFFGGGERRPAAPRDVVQA